MPLRWETAMKKKGTNKSKKLIALILSILIAVCGCGAAQESTAAQSSEAVQESEAAQESKAAQDSTAAQASEASTGREASTEQSVPDVEAGILGIDKYGNIFLTIGPETMTSLGYEPGDIVRVQIGKSEMEMPIGTNYTDVDSGKPVCTFKSFADVPDEVVLVINAGSMADTLGIAEKRTIEEDPGFEWVFSDGLDASAAVHISMAQKQGYLDEYEMKRVTGQRSNDRSDYPELSDAEFANFRAVNTGRMGKDTLFRSSSPIDPTMNRNKEADDALLDAMIRTVMNLADSESGMKSYADYGLTNYSECSVIALDTTVDFSSDDFRQKLADGYRFLSTHRGPYLIHCNEGKDRTGFAVGILECLMGADADEIMRDYMLTYYNYYGITPDSQQYKNISASNIETYLAQAFGISSIREEGVDLQACAEEFLMDIGMNEEEVTELKEKLSEDYGGISAEGESQ